MGKTKNKVKQHREKSLEQLFGGGIDDILGFSHSEKKQESRSGELRPGEEVSFAKSQEEKSEPQEEKTYIEPAINYAREVANVGERLVSTESREMEAQLREIMAEIKKLTDSSKELQVQFREVAVDNYVAAPGKYHKTFFSWLLSVIRAARMKVEDSDAWLQALQSKKKSKGYGAMTKKHGTSFSLSNERNVSNQVG